nr:group II intron maturase-specific domain-containing protein [Limosilactobacillus reuteri]
MVSVKLGAYARPAKQSQQRVKKALKLLTKRNRGISLTRMFEEIHRKMRGWLQYYGAYARPAKQSQQRVKKALKLLTKRNRGISLTRMFEEIHRKMRGWLQYYSTGELHIVRP